jgi:hypothetical protein
MVNDEGVSKPGSGAGPAATYAVARADVGADEAALAALFATNLRTRGDPRDRLRWFYRDAPAGRGAAFLLSHAVGAGAPAIIGCAGAGMRAFWAGGARLRAGLLGDFAVDRDHRTAMPALIVQRQVRAFVRGELDFGYGFPNEAAAAVFKRLGYAVLGQLERWVRVLRVEPYARRLTPYAIAASAARAADRMIGVADLALSVPARIGYELAWTAGVDERFDRLWERARAGYAVVGDRGAATLRWRFFGRPGARYEIAALVDRSSRDLVAYAVLQEEGEVARICDVFAPSARELHRLLARLIAALHARGFAAASLRFLGPPRARRVLERLGFRVRGRQAVIVEPGERSAVPAASLLRPEGWLLTDFDEDD